MWQCYLEPLLLHLLSLNAFKENFVYISVLKRAAYILIVWSYDLVFTYLLNTFSLSTLHSTRKIACNNLFLYNLVHGCIDGPRLSSKLNFRIPGLESRPYLSFLLPLSNILHHFCSLLVKICVVVIMIWVQLWTYSIQIKDGSANCVKTW